jgi:spore coat protein U-like protein
MKRLLVATTALIGLLGVQTGWAATATSTITVSANVANACTIGASPLSFGTLVPSTTYTATTTINVTCTSGGAYSVGLDFGTSGVGSLTLVGTNNPAHQLSYGLFKDPTHTITWTNSSPLPGAGIGSLQTVTVFGQLITGGSPAADTYTDTVTATITY